MPTDSLHELKRQARAIDDNTSDASSCTRSHPVVDFHSGERSRIAIIAFCDNNCSLIPRCSLNASTIKVLFPFPRSSYSLNLLPQVHPPPSLFFFPLPSSLVHRFVHFFRAGYICPIGRLMKTFEYSMSCTDKLAGLTSLIASLGDSSMSGWSTRREDKLRMFVLAYVLLVSRTSGLFVQAIARERSVATNEPL